MWDSFNQYAEKREIIKIISEKTGIPSGAIFIAFMFLLVTLLFQGFGGLMIMLFLCFMYPAYGTYKALKYNQQEQVLRWAKYWVVLSFAVFVYEIIDWFLSALPLLGLFKFTCVFFMVRGQGATAAYLYDILISPMVAKYESFIDSHLASIENVVSREQEKLAATGAKMAGAAMGAAMAAKTSA